MQELKERGAQIFTNPYVIQVDKFAGSLPVWKEQDFTRSRVWPK